MTVLMRSAVLMRRAVLMRSAVLIPRDVAVAICALHRSRRYRLVRRRALDVRRVQTRRIGQTVADRRRNRQKPLPPVVTEDFLKK